MASTITEIARYLMRQPKEEQRETFALILAFLRHQSGDPNLVSLHDFITGRGAVGLNAGSRERLLSVIAMALRSGDTSTLEIPTP